MRRDLEEYQRPILEKLDEFTSPTPLFLQILHNSYELRKIALHLFSSIFSSNNNQNNSSSSSSSSSTTSPPIDPSSFSWWLAFNLPLNDHERIWILNMDVVAYRIK